jgi:hypothetical protein
MEMGGIVIYWLEDRWSVKIQCEWSSMKLSRRSDLFQLKSKESGAVFVDRNQKEVAINKRTTWVSKGIHTI